MNLKIYKRTRYQNIYKHIKNGNYVVEISKPIKTSVSKVDGLKIFDIDTAISIRDSYSKSAKIDARGNVTTFWGKYMYDCEFVRKLKPRTLKKKRNIYNKYIKEFYPDKLLIRITEYHGTEFFKDKVFDETTDKQKNHVLKELKAFFNWCCEKKYIKDNPLYNIKKLKVEKPVIKFWEVDDFIKFITVVEEDLHSNVKRIKSKAYLVYVLSYIGMGIGDRVGETRILKFSLCLRQYGVIYIGYDIDDTAEDFQSTTKTEGSTRYAEAPEELFDVIDGYKKYLEIELEVEINKDTYIFVNPKTGVPYSDTNLRNHFDYYIKKAGVPRITMYQLRHSYVANLLSQGIELELISPNIGHTDFSTTMNYYGGISKIAKKKLVKGASNIFQK